MILPSRHMAARGLPLLTGELPTAVPRAFTAYAALTLPVCVPRSTVPRSTIWPFCQRNACVLNAVVEYPTTCAASFKSYANVILPPSVRSEEHTSELQSLAYLVCCLLLE